MARPLGRLLPLLALLAAGAILFVAILPNSGPTVGTDPPELAALSDSATPIDVVTGFTDSLNAGDVDRVIQHLDPAVAAVFLPGVAGMVEPSPDELLDALERYRLLGQTISIEQCEESSAPLDIQTGLRTLSAGAAGGTVLDCSLIYTSSFGRRIGLEEDTRLFMRFDVGDNGIGAMYLSPMLQIGG